jgi:hypothetical protein
MKRRKRITRLTVETERTLVFRARQSTETRWCARCKAKVEMAFVDAAAKISGLTEMMIYNFIEERSLHLAEDESRRVLVCLNSLLNDRK